MGKSCCNTSVDEDKARGLLAQKNINKTKIKVALLMALSHAKRPLSVVEIYGKLKNINCDISTVFRSMGQFKERGLAREINLGEGFFRYEIVVQDASHHHHHIRCRKCGAINQLGDCDLSRFEKMIHKLGYKDFEHHLEFTGLCPKCS